ncbi:phosphotransferase [Nesterenkonia halotolerans]|uniref:Aminoglycoside phosphotransferase domain-containing protein n=1 Tax=Nesterenkonia halotolerans TaxID=225325 RepID=A0ABR9J5F7_9MICC|nr:phosphotransferase [Nesterenkonia halotolerans]MBE1514230.1 hypothetical protein [Nesterenkonia halotolerans]
MNQDVSLWTEADEVAARAVGLPGARLLLDPGELSTLVEEPVTITRIRAKPGHSLVAAFQTEARDPRWAMLTLDTDKLAKARVRAAERGGSPSFRVHTDIGPYLFSGSLWTDPVLGKDLAEARRAIEATAGATLPWQVLRHNPRRRVVAVVPDPRSGHGDKIVRVASRGTTAALEATQRWRALGLPLVRSTSLGGRGTAMSSPRWGWDDLNSTPHPPAAQTAGEVVGRLHRLTRGSQRMPLPSELRSSERSISTIAPWLAASASHLAEGVQERLTAERGDHTCELHGDLSPDQVVMAAPGSHKIRLIDFDRSGTGDPMRDVGSWLASCRRQNLESMSAGFMDGYREHAELDDRRAATWEAYAQLAAASDPFRHRAPDWPAQMHTMLQLGQEALDR